MDIKAYKDFINGRYLSEGIRITAGILLPAFLMSYFNLLAAGIVMSVGALCVSATDTPGPVNHRVNGMFVCNIVIGIIAVIICYVNDSVLLTGSLIFVFGFVFSMLSVYGTRTSSIGIAALLVMILNLQTGIHGVDILNNALYILVGGTWYMLFSLLLYKIRPYKLIQQTLGDYIQSIGGYLIIRGELYHTNPDYEKINALQFQQQVNVQEQQNLLSELLFKTREIVKESTHTGRVLLKIYLAVADLFESIMTTYQQYTILHQKFDSTGILDEFRSHILSIANELNDIGVAIKSGIKSYPSENNLNALKQIRVHFESLRLHYMTNENVDDFISLGRILNNLQDLSEKINELHFYTTYDKKISKSTIRDIDYSTYSESEDIRPSLFFNNLNLRSNIFRHSLRVAVALLVGYIISLFFHLGHSYWILLTIVVILKPAYSLTKKRNKDRLIGTFLGIILGAVILLVIKNNIALLVLMVLFMAISYVYLRISYFVSVLFMTPYLVIFFHILNPGNLKVVLTDRILDTAIGSAIAFLASIFFVPQWEHITIKLYMIEMLKANSKYYQIVGNGFSGIEIINMEQLKKARRDVLVALANLSDAFTRMLSEPKRFQKSTESLHYFVVLNHSLTSHLATLSYYLTNKGNNFRSADVAAVVKNTELHFENAINYLEGVKKVALESDRNALQKLNEYALVLLQKRKNEIALGDLETETKALLVQVKSVVDQFNYIYRVATEISKSCKES